MGKGGGSGGGSQQTTYTPPQFLLPYISAYLNKIAGASGTGGLSNETYAQAGYPNQQVAPLSALEQQYLSLVPQEAAQVGGVNTAGLDEAAATLKGQYLVPPKAVTDALNYQINQEYQQTTAPSEMAAAAQAGAFGGSADAEQRALNQFNLGTAESNTAYGLYEQERQNQIATAADLPKLDLAAQQPSEQLLQAGGLQQSQQQNELNALYNNLFNKANFPFEQAGLLGSALGTAGGGAGTAYQTSTGQSPGTLGTIEGLGGLGGLLYASGALGTWGSAGAGSGLLGGIASALPAIAAFL